MSDSYLYRLSQQLRLLARVDGTVNPQIEQPRSALNDILDLCLDGHRINELQKRHIQWCEELIKANRPAVKQLELTWSS